MIMAKKKKKKSDPKRIIMLIETNIDPDEMADMARMCDSLDEFSDMVLDTLLSRMESGWEGVTAGWDNPEVQDYLERVYNEARGALPPEEVKPPAPPPPRYITPPAPAPTAEKPPTAPPRPSLWERVKRGIRRIFGR
jgi:hypothetical protein